MKVTVIGASGLIGTKVVDLLTNNGHEVVASSRKTGVDVLTGEGLADALTGADALVDVTNSPSFEDDPVMEFFTKSTTNLVDAARAAGVRHYVVLSIVGVDGLPDSGYMRAKVVQEKDHHRIRGAVHDIACHAVRRVRRRDHGVHDRRRRGASAGCVDPAGGRRSGGRRGRARRRRRAPRWHREHRWARKDLVRADGPCGLGRPRATTQTVVVDPGPRTSARRWPNAAW